jgi:NO-binding membrane sensor protein with MHYT domain
VCLLKEYTPYADSVGSYWQAQQRLWEQLPYGRCHTDSSTSLTRFIRSMHFIGMEAIVMADGRPELQIYYYPAFIAGSFFLPIAVVAIAFSLFSTSRNVSIWRIVLSGTVCGTAICGMHYLGQAGIVNYWNIWDWKYVLASAIIAVTAATIALGVFFYLKSKWINALWKRALCAMALAGAVSLMHWTAILGTTYAWRGTGDIATGLTKTSAVWVCGALALSCCLVLVTLAILFQYLRRVYLKKAQQVSVALAYWDSDGRIMLNASGLLPSTKITKSYLQRSSKDTFDTEHPVFSWMFRVTRHWNSVHDLVPSMRRHIKLELGGDNVSIASVSGKPFDYSSILKELFCTAAQDLANIVDEPLNKVGVLYDKILTTGNISPRVKMFITTPTINSPSDAEQGYRQTMTLGRGQVCVYPCFFFLLRLW